MHNYTIKFRKKKVSTKDKLQYVFQRGDIQKVRSSKIPTFDTVHKKYCFYERNQFL